MHKRPRPSDEESNDVLEMDRQFWMNLEEPEEEILENRAQNSTTSEDLVIGDEDFWLELCIDDVDEASPENDDAEQGVIQMSINDCIAAAASLPKVHSLFVINFTQYTCKVVGNDWGDIVLETPQQDFQDVAGVLNLPHLLGHYIEGLNRHHNPLPPPHHRRRAEPPPKPPPKKRLKLTSEAAIMEAHQRQCCKKICCSLISIDALSATRHRYANKNEHERSEMLLSFISSNRAEFKVKWRYSFQGRALCRNAALALFGAGKRKWDGVFKIYMAGGLFVPKPLRQWTARKLRLDITMGWLSGFFEQVGDQLPDGSIHLPIIVPWSHLYAFYREDVALETSEPYSYRIFRCLIGTNFPKVSFHFLHNSTLLIYTSRSKHLKVNGWANVTPASIYLNGDSVV